jgi:hypothetical protein
LTTFEFLLALYVILAGLGMTLLVRSVGQMIEAHANVQTYWIHTAWIILIFLVHITSWFSFWEFRHIATWSIGQFLMLLSIPVLLYLISHICVPEVLDNGTHYDMRSYFYQRHRIMLGLLALTMALNLLNDYFLVGAVIFSPVNLARLLVLLLVLVGAIFRHPRVHGFIVVILVLLMIYSASFLNHTIS